MSDSGHKSSSKKVRSIGQVYIKYVLSAQVTGVPTWFVCWAMRCDSSPVSYHLSPDFI